MEKVYLSPIDRQLAAEGHAPEGPFIEINRTSFIDEVSLITKIYEDQRTEHDIVLVDVLRGEETATSLIYVKQLMVEVDTEREVLKALFPSAEELRYVGYYDNNHLWEIVW